MLGANAIVGASLPLGGRRRRCRASCSSQGRVAVAFFGEGAVNQGAFHEAVNLAAIWDLPALLVCENNVYAEFSDSRTMTRVPAVAERAAAYGIEAELVDGNDVEAVLAAAPPTPPRAAATATGPFLIEAETYRWHGHYEGDAQPYKPEDEAAAWRERDPLRGRRRAARRARRGRARASWSGSASEAPAGSRPAIERARELPRPRPRGGLRGCLSAS